MMARALFLRSPLLLALALGCSGSENAAPAPATPPAKADQAAKSETPKAAPKLAPAAPLAAAPTLSVLGITLGQADDAAITAWLGARGLSCPAAPSSRRTTVRYQCGGETLKTALPERTGSLLEQLVLVRTDQGPLHHLSMRSRYSLPAEAATTYNSTVARVRELLGEPTLARPAPEQIDATKSMVWYSTVWRYTDLEVSVSLLRAGGAHYDVSKRWQLPHFEEDAPLRPGVAPFSHGAPSAPSTNPHVTTTP